MGITSIKQEPVEEEDDKHVQRIEVVFLIPGEQRKDIMKGLALARFAQDFLRIFDSEAASFAFRGHHEGREPTFYRKSSL